LRAPPDFGFARARAEWNGPTRRPVSFSVRWDDVEYPHAIGKICGHLRTIFGKQKIAAVIMIAPARDDHGKPRLKRIPEADGAKCIVKGQVFAVRRPHQSRSVQPPGNEPSDATRLPSETRNTRSGSAGKSSLNAPEPGSTIMPGGYVHLEPPLSDPTAIIAWSGLNARAPTVATRGPGGDSGKGTSDPDGVHVPTSKNVVRPRPPPTASILPSGENASPLGRRGSGFSPTRTSSVATFLQSTGE
jgi:hypothetical protein